MLHRLLLIIMALTTSGHIGQAATSSYAGTLEFQRIYNQIGRNNALIDCHETTNGAVCLKLREQSLYSFNPDTRTISSEAFATVDSPFGPLMNQLSVVQDPNQPNKYYVGAAYFTAAGTGAVGIHAVTVSVTGETTSEPVLYHEVPPSNFPATWGHFGMQIVATVENGETVLYAGIGDGKAATIVSQDPTSLSGKIVRLLPGGDEFPEDPLQNYSTVGNPDYGKDALGAIFALGARNPFRMHLDKYGRLVIYEVGEDAVEAAFILDIGPDQEQANLGWPRFEGGIADFLLDAALSTDITTLIDSTITIFHNTGSVFDGDSITGGDLFTGEGPLNGQLVFADYGHHSSGACSEDGKETTFAKIYSYDQATDNLQVWYGCGAGLERPVWLGMIGDEFYVSDIRGGTFRMTAVAPIPLPFGGALLLGGLGAFAVARRKRS